MLDDPLNNVDPLGLCIGGGGSASGDWQKGYQITCPHVEGPFYGNLDVSLKSPGERLGGGDDSDAAVQCPAAGSTIGKIRNWAKRTADITGKGADITALAGAVPTPATPGLEASSLGLRAISLTASVVQLGADVAFGNSSLFWSDVGGIAASRIPLGSGFAYVSRHQPGGPSLSQQGLKKFSEVTNAGTGLIVAYTYPEDCK